MQVATTADTYQKKFRVYYEDTDAGGIVYHANYLKFCERVRSDFVREVVEFSQTKTLQQEKKGFVISAMHAKFVGAAHLEDEITVSCIPIRAKGASMEMYQEVLSAEGNLLFAMLVRIAFLDFNNNFPTIIPSEFVDKVKAYVPSGDDGKALIDEIKAALCR